MTDDAGVIVMANPRVKEIFGYTDDELIGQPVHVLVPTDIQKRHEKYHNDYQKHPQPRSMGVGMDLFGRRKDGGQVPLEISLNPVELDDERLVAAFIVDITERKRLERELKEHTQNLEQLVSERTRELEHLNLGLRTQVLERKKAEQALIKSQRDLKVSLEKERELNSLKSRFVSMASHEFRTPLSTILSSISLIDRYIEAGSSDKTEKHIHKIQNSVSHLTNILEDFLSLGKLEEGKITPVFEEVDLCQFTEGILEDFGGLLKEGQNIDMGCPTDLIIDSDKKMLRHVVSNLVSNAIKYSDKGTIKIAVEDRPEENEVKLSIADEGIGIPKKDQKNMFDRFFRAANSINIEGTGLGLNIVSKHLELLDGRITFESEEGIGSTFYIHLKKQHGSKNTGD